MSLLGWLRADAHVRGTIDGTVSFDVLDRIARIATSPTMVHDADPPHRLRIHTVGSYIARMFKPTGPFEDVRLEVDEGRLRFEVHFPKGRVLAIAFWAFLWAFVNLFQLLVAPSLAMWGALVTAPIFWLLAAWTIADERRNVTALLARVVNEARAQ